jgi:hypothetical protein
MSDQLLREGGSVEAKTSPKLNRPHPLTSEQTPEEIIARLRSFPARAAQLKETLDASRATVWR